MGPADSANRYLGVREHSRRFQLNHALGGTHAGAFSPPRTRFARARVPRAFSRFF